jgi:hypothetical protein
MKRIPLWLIPLTLSKSQRYNKAEINETMTYVIETRAKTTIAKQK